MMMSKTLRDKVATYADTVDDQTIRDELNAQTIERTVEPSVPQISKTVMESGEWTEILAATENQDTNIADAAAYVVDLCRAVAGTIDLTLPAISAAFDVLDNNDIITQELHEDIIALTVETVSWAEDNGLRKLRTGDIEMARAKLEDE